MIERLDKHEEFVYGIFRGEDDFEEDVRMRPCFKFEDGSVYEGEWHIELDIKHGRGKLVYPSGTVYEGYWRNNLENGRGRITFINGDIYQGYFKNGKANGYGEIY